MNEMYEMSIVMHNYSVYGILAVVLINALMLLGATNLSSYKKFVTIFMPIGMTVIAALIFTGVVMMAAKHLDFTMENIAMILFCLVLIILENIRSRKLKRVDMRIEGALARYKAEAFKILIMEVFVVLSISIWMWL